MTTPNLPDLPDLPDLTADRCFWLDGGGSTSWSGSRSLIGVLTDDDVSLTFDAERREVTRHQGGRTGIVGDDIFEVLEQSLDGDPDTHWVGCLGYAARTDLPGRPANQGPANRWPDNRRLASPHAASQHLASRTPDAIWMRARHVTWIDEPARQAPAISPASGVTSEAPEAAMDHDYAVAFTRVQEELHAGNTYEANLTYRVVKQSDEHPLAVYRRLRAANPAPYAGYLAHRGTHLLSASPERFATVDRRRWIETRPIKGTTPRGRTPEEDRRLREHLASDAKYRAENLMIVDLLRNDLSMVCEPGTVNVPSLMQVESYASVHQLVSTVRGRLRPEVSTLQALRAIFPAGSMTGAPKLRTMQIIDEVEATPRGLYAGAFGWISGDGRADLGVVIRSLVRTPGHGWHVGTGGGITVRSDVAEEWAETRWKADRVLSVLD